MSIGFDMYLALEGHEIKKVGAWGRRRGVGVGPPDPQWATAAAMGPPELQKVREIRL